MSNTTPVAGCRVRWLLLAGLLATLSCAQAERVVHRFDVERPRDFGYLLGDVLETRVHLEMAASHELVADKLPEGARISRWLEQDPIEIESTVGSELRRYDMLLRYRVVATPSEVQAVEVPGLTLDVSGPGHLFALAIPAWALTTAATPRATGSALIVVSVTLIIPRHIFLRFGCLLLRFACSKQALFR